MIQLTRINRTSLLVNPDHIEHVATAPDTILTFSNGKNLMVLESPEEIVRRVLAFKQQVLSGLPFTIGGPVMESTQSWINQ